MMLSVPWLNWWKSNGAWKKIMFVKFVTGAHKYDYDYGNKNDLIQWRFALIKVELFQKQRRLLDGIWVKVEIVGKLPNIHIMTWETNLVFFYFILFIFLFYEEGKPIRLLLSFLSVEEKTNPWCGTKDYSLVCKESPFLIKKLMYFLFIKE